MNKKKLYHGHSRKRCERRNCSYLLDKWCCAAYCHADVSKRARLHNARIGITIPGTRVVNMKHEECDVRIDRQSRWGNPFLIGKDGTRSEVIEKYRTYLLTRVDLLRDLEDMSGLYLGCWCKPLACHGDIIVEFIENGVPWRKVPKRRIRRW